MNSDIPLFALIFVLAFLVEALVEYFLGTPFEKVEKLKPWRWLLQYIALAVGILGAINYRFDLIAVLGDYFGVEIETTWFGIITTGAVIGRGSNFVHDIIKLISEIKLNVRSKNQ